MFYGLHTTKRKEREILLDREGELIEIDPASFQEHPDHKCMVWEEDTGKFYEHKYDEFHDVLKELENNSRYDIARSDYYKRWKYKGAETDARLARLLFLFNNIKDNGIQEPVQCEVTGERLDGSYRTKIAMYLGIPKVKAIRHKFHWSEIDEDFLKRKIESRWLASGKEYYQFQYPNGWWNIPDGGNVYKENAERWDVIAPFVKGSVLDVGCNEGYVDIQLARLGHKVTGIDINFTHNAWLNKLIFEYCDQKDLPVEFHEESVVDTKRTADTILMLNVLYHVPRDKQKEVLMKFKGKNIIFQCNLRKERERDNYYTSHPDDLKDLLKECGFKIKKEIDWRDKPIIVV